MRIVLLILLLLLWWWALSGSFSCAANYLIIVGGLLLVFPVVWLGRKMVDKDPSLERLAWITTFVHYAAALLFFSAAFRAVVTHEDWPGPSLPVPTWIGSILVIITSLAALLAVLNLALKGLGAPFAIVLSKKLAVDWLYAWTRNPMVLGTLALLVSLGIWYQSTLFVLWALLLFTPALLFFVKIYEERELEIRFGESYLAYKARTPMIFPRRPK